MPLQRFNVCSVLIRSQCVIHCKQKSLFLSHFFCSILCCQQGSHDDRRFPPPLLPSALVPVPHCWVRATWKCPSRVLDKRAGNGHLITCIFSGKDPIISVAFFFFFEAQLFFLMVILLILCCNNPDKYTHSLYFAGCYCSPSVELDSPICYK